MDSKQFTVSVSRPALLVNRAKGVFPQARAREISRAARINLFTVGGNKVAGRLYADTLRLIHLVSR